MASWSAPRRVAASLWLVLAAVVFASSFGVFNPDVKPEVYLAPVRSLSAYLSAWQTTPQLGFPSFNVGLAPVAGVVAALQGLGLDADYSARVLRLILLTVAALGGANLVRRVLPPPVSGWTTLAVAVCYLANPYTVVAGGTLAVLWPYALLPWLIVCLLRAVTEGHGWRWPAAGALVLAAMTGMNAGVVPLIQLAAVPPFLLLAKSLAGCRWRDVAVVLVRWGLLSALVSAYWLVPTISAAGAGQTVVDNSETVAGISNVSSWAEVLRGLGLWPVYGGDASGPWVPEQIAYLTSVLVILLSFGWTAMVGAALVWARGAARAASLAALVLTATIMVGLFPGGSRSPFSRLLELGFADLPGLAAFRTTNKAGAGLVLAASLLVGAAVHRMVLRPAPRLGRLTLTGLSALVLVGATAPVWTGGIYTSPMPVPDYWHQAATALDGGSADQRVWFLPGQVASDYRWSRQRPDDLGNSLLRRPTLVRYVIPVTGEEAANLLQAVDQGLQEGSLPPGTLSKVARRLGVGDVLVRNDVVWEASSGARPETVQAAVVTDRGLLPVRNFGAPGENTRSPTIAPADSFEAAFPPLQQYSVTASGDPLHAESAVGTVILSGDGFAVAPAMSAGLIPDGVAYRYAGDLDEAAFAAIMRAGARIVLSDTNRRRTTVGGRLTGGLGPLLRSDQDPGSTRALFDSRGQTTLVTPGVRVDASQVGSVFGTYPQAAAVNAVDQDPKTSWRFGDFSTAVGQSLTVSTDHAYRYGQLDVNTSSLGAVHISRIRLQAGATTREVAVGPEGVAHADLGGATSDRLTLTVTGTSGNGFNLVGVFGISGLPMTVHRAAALPALVDGLVAALPTQDASALGSTPVDVLLNRVTGVAATTADDEETALDRDFSLPVTRNYRLYGTVQPGPDVPESQLDLLAGSDGTVVAESSSRAFDLPTLRASQAVDGNPTTGWTPAVALGSWIRFSGPSREVRSVRINQPALGARGAWATKIEVLVDGKRVGEGAVGPGPRTIPVVPTKGSTVELRVTAVSGPGAIRILETDAAGRTVTFDRDRAARACITVASLDGGDLLVQPLQPITSAAPVLFGSCGGTSLALSAGTHQLRGSRSWLLDTVVLRDQSGERVLSAIAPQVSGSSGSTSADVDVAPSAAPYYLVLGQAFDPRWSATLDGHDLGAPVVVDGWSAGWLVAASGPHHIAIIYRPQQLATRALGVSLIAIVLTSLLLVRRPKPRPSRGDVPRDVSKSRAREAYVWSAVVVGSWFLGGALAGGVALLLVLWCVLGTPAPRWMFRVGLALWCSLGLAFVLGSSGRLGSVTPELVTGNVWPSQLALTGLVALVVGVVYQSLLGSSGTLPDRG